MYEKTIICLANSRKPPSSTGRCVAGKEVTGEYAGQWVRPISPRPSHEVSITERRYTDGTEIGLLDIIKITFIEHQPLMHQTENHVFDSSLKWEKKGKADWNQLREFIDPDDKYFWKTSSDTKHGINDEIFVTQLKDISSSLKLIYVQKLELRVQSETYPGGSRRRVRGYLQYEGKNYLISVTDPYIEMQYLHQKEGQYFINDAILCISLAGVFEERKCAYRLIASVITKDRC